MLKAASNVLDPLTFEEAMKSKDKEAWMKAAQEEFDSLIENGTLVLEDLPAGRKAIDGKWIFRRKFKPDGSIDRYKARFVVRGFKRISGIDYLEHELFSPVVTIQTVRFLLALAAELDMELEHLDVCTAFLNGDLKETIYINQPQGFVNRRFRRKVCRLLKSLYGLKQSPKCWFDKINAFLLSCGFIHSSSDPNMYVLMNSKGLAALALYVDDLILAATCMELIVGVKSLLMNQFKMKQLGNLTYCLGVQVHQSRSRGTISIYQAKYITDIVARFNLSDAKPVSTPLALGVKLSEVASPSAESDSFR